MLHKNNYINNTKIPQWYLNNTLPLFIQSSNNTFNVAYSE
jgi:hypothetical protein